MKCPYCGTEMEAGYVQSMKEIIYAQRMHTSAFFQIPRKSDIKLTEGFWAPAMCMASRCAACRKIILSY